MHFLKCSFNIISLVLHPGSNSHIGCWARVEGTPPDLNADKPFAKMQNTPLFNNEGRLNPSITILGKILSQFNSFNSMEVCG